MARALRQAASGGRGAAQKRYDSHSCNAARVCLDGHRHPREEWPRDPESEEKELAPDEALDWIVPVFDVLFVKKYPGRKGFGLLVVVRERYAAEGLTPECRLILGDGTLWLALLKSLLKIRADDERLAVEKALALRSVFREEDLLASTDPGRMWTLMSRLERWRAKTLAPSLARKAVRTLEALENCLARKFSDFKEGQAGTAGLHGPADLLWSPTGWATVREEVNPYKVEAYLHRTGATVPISLSTVFYVNVSKAAQSDDEIGQALAAVLRFDQEGDLAVAS